MPTDKQPDYFSNQVIDARRWFLALPEPKDEGLITVSVGCERCEPDYVVRRTTFEFEAIEFVAQGEGTLILNGTRHTLRPGSVFSYREDVPHLIENTSRSPMLKYFLDCGGQLARNKFDESTVGGGRIVQIGSVADLVEIFELIIANAMSETEFSGAICSTLVETLLLKVSEKTIQGGAANTRAWATYDQARRHIQENFIRIKAMTEVSDEIGIDPAYLSRVFRRFHHSTPYKYLMRLKMSHAAALLLTPDSLVKNVSAELEFEDPFHFSRSFKSVYGISPEQFIRRQQR